MLTTSALPPLPPARPTTITSTTTTTTQPSRQHTLYRGTVTQLTAVRRLLLTTDGCSRGNPGEAGAGAVLCDAEDPDNRVEVALYLGFCSNNTAEYAALLLGMLLAIACGARVVDAVTDSQLVANQFGGAARVNHPMLSRLLQAARSLRNRFSSFTLSHQRRAFTSQADALANAAVEAKRDATFAARHALVIGEPLGDAVTALLHWRPEHQVSMECRTENCSSSSSSSSSRSRSES